MLECLGACSWPFWDVAGTKESRTRFSRICLEQQSTGSLAPNHQSAMHLYRTRISISKQLRMFDASSVTPPFLIMGQ